MMNSAKYKIYSISWKLLILLLIGFFVHSAQSAVFNNSVSNNNPSDDSFAALNSFSDVKQNVLDKIQPYCVSLGGDFGVIISADGYVLTSSYESKALTFSVVIDGTKYDCQKVGWQEAGGIALYKISADIALPYAEIQKQLPEVGDSVFAYGNTLSMFTNSTEIREGKISNQHHFVNTCPDSLIADIQASNGFNGGGLFDASGKLTGIICGNISEQIYATPIEAAMRFVKTWLQKEGICFRGTIDGIFLAENINTFDGAKIVSIVTKSQAAEIDLKIGDLVTEIENRQVRSNFDFWNILSSYPESWNLTLKIARGNEEKVITCKLSQGLKNQLSKYSFNSLIPTVPNTNVITDNGDNKKPAYLGISTDKNLDRKIRGIPVYKVADGSPASAAGFIKGDIILSINGQAMYDFASLENFLDTHHAGTEVVFDIMRGEDRISFKVILAEKK